MLKLLPTVLSTILFVGCDDVGVNRNIIITSKKIVKNRELYAKEIITATNDCIKAATSVQTLAAASNDQAETVEECKEAAQQAYGAYNPYSESELLKFANLN